VLAMRQMGVSLWDITAASEIEKSIEGLRRMLPEEVRDKQEDLD